MMPVSRSARVLLSIAVVSLVAMVLLYAFPASDRRTLIIISDICWGWAAGFGAFFAGQLVWTYYDLWHGAPRPYPSLADIGFLGIYVCLIAGVSTLVRGQPARRADPELALDTVLVTFTVGAFAYEFLLEPLLRNSTPVAPLALLTSIGWSVGAVAVLWIILIQMLRRPVFP